MAITTHEVEQDHSGEWVQTAELAVLSLTKLLRNDPAELASLVRACENEGFFYLDLHDWKSGKMLEDLDIATRLMRLWFEKPLEEKMKNHTDDDCNGYASESTTVHIVEY